MQVELLVGVAAVPPAIALAEVSPCGLVSLVRLVGALASPDGQGPVLLLRHQVGRQHHCYARPACSSFHHRLGSKCMTVGVEPIVAYC